MPSAGDQPGWLPDPEKPGALRWWNGLGWSDARKAPDGATDRAIAAARQAVESSTLTPQQVARTTATRTTTQVVPGVAGTGARAAAGHCSAPEAGLLAEPCVLSGSEPCRRAMSCRSRQADA